MSPLEEPNGDGEADMVGRLLRAAGPRTDVPGERAARVRDAVRADWLALRRRRSIIRRIVAGASLAAVALLVADLARDRGGSLEPAAPPGPVVAVVERIEGVAAGGSATTSWRTLAPRDGVRAGEWIRTDEAARLALRWPDGTSVRLDAATRLRTVSTSEIELAAGAVYVDSRSESGSLQIRTPLGSARDIGTQFELRLIGDALRLRVRTGLVELADRARSVTGRRGTEVLWSATGIATQPVPTSGPEWDWIGRVARPLDIEGVALASFLDEVAREQGWTLLYAEPSLERESAAIVLHGSVRGLGPREAVEVAVRSGGLRHRFDASHLVVLRDQEPR